MTKEISEASETPVEERLRDREAEMAWMMPALHSPGYGISSMKLIRCCITSEPVTATWHRPFDHHDLIGVTQTAAAAPSHLSERAQAVIEWMRGQLAADDPEAVRRADKALEEEK